MGNWQKRILSMGYFIAVSVLRESCKLLMFIQRRTTEITLIAKLNYVAKHFFSLICKIFCYWKLISYAVCKR